MHHPSTPLVLHSALLPQHLGCGSGDPGHVQCLMVSWHRSGLLHHNVDILAGPRPLPHPGLPLHDGMHHLRHQLHYLHGGLQSLRPHGQLLLPRLCIQWVCPRQSLRFTKNIYSIFIIRSKSKCFIVKCISQHTGPFWTVKHDMASDSTEYIPSHQWQ